MNKRLYILILLPYLFLTCQKEPETPQDPIIINYTVEDVSTYGGNDGSIHLMVSGGIPPYSFNWSNNEKTQDLENIPAGEYIVVISDSNYQLFTQTIEVCQPDPDAIIISYQIISPSEEGATNGSIIPSVCGGYPPFNYYWSNGSNKKDLTNLSAGTYILTVSDSEGQIRTDSVLILDLLADVDGNKYNAVKIGSQIWMKENLRVTHSPDNKPIINYIYENDTVNLKSYGRLYTWDAAMNGSTLEGTQGICPCGWHVPTDEELKTLEICLGMTHEESNQENIWRGENVGTKLKAGGTSGFDSQLSGRRTSDGNFGFKDRAEYIWSSTEYANDYAWRRCLDKLRNDVGRYNTFPKSYAFSIRCLKDEE